MKHELPKAVTYGVETAEIGFIGVGMTYGVILETMDILAESDIHTQYHQVRTLCPMLEETASFTNRCKVIFVLEYNAGAQLANIIIANGGNEDRIKSILRFDGVPMNSKEIVKEVLTYLNIKKVDVA